jgi:O-antigen ligase/8-oxo-dGTP pyrophosphatase MutT (NUDIX family)
MNVCAIVNFIDRWGAIFFIYLLPWQARIIFEQGFLSGAPFEPRTRSLFVLEAVLWILIVFRLIAMNFEKNRVKRSRFYSLNAVSGILFSLLAIAGLALFSSLVSVDRSASLLLAFRLLEGAAVFFLIVTVPIEREARIAFIAGAAVQAVMAIAQIVFQRVYPNTWLGIAPHYPEASGTSVVETVAERFLRAYGTLPHPNILGGFMVAAIFAVRTLFRRVSFVGLGLSFLFGTALFFTFSRTAWIAFFVGAILQWLYARRDGVFIRHALSTLLAFSICSALFFPLVLVRVTADGRLEDKSVSARLSAVNDAFSLIKKHGLTGVGAGAFGQTVANEIDRSRDGFSAEPPHNVPLSVAAEIGIFGLAVYLYFLYLATRLAWRSGKVGLAAALLILICGDHWAWTTYAGIIIFMASWGFTVRGCNDGGVTNKAGAVIISKNDPAKILLLYRDGPNYCDWTLPKGHMEPGESREDTMRREVMEETGLAVEIIRILPDRDYLTGNGHAAIVHFFLTRSLDDSQLRLEPGFTKNKLEWVYLDRAEDTLSFDNMKQYFRSVFPMIKEAINEKKGA